MRGNIAAVFVHSQEIGFQMSILAFKLLTFNIWHILLVVSVGSHLFTPQHLQKDALVLKFKKQLMC